LLRTARHLLVSCVIASCLITATGCGHRAPLPTLQAPLPTAREDALPETARSSLVIPLSVPLRVVQELVRERLRLPSADDWVKVSGEGDNPEVAIRYQAELGELTLALEGPLVHTSVPIHYFGSFRARAETPFGSIWLTKNTRWGSREQPGTITLRIRSQLSLAPGWQLATSSVLEDVVLTAPDVDKLCAGKVFRVCVPIELARARVHAELDKQVRAHASAGLAELDAQVAARADLERLARVVWERLQAVRTTASGAALTLAPESMSVSYPALEGDALVLTLQVWARPRWSAAAQPAAQPLPAAAEARTSPDELHYALPVSYATLNQHLSAALVAETNDAGYRVSELRLLGAAPRPGRWLWAATLEAQHETGVVYGECTLRLAGSSVSLADIEVPEAAAPLLRATGFSDEPLGRALSRAADLAQPLAERVAELRALLVESVSPWPARPLAHVTSALESAHAASQGVVFSAVAR
jgi:Domain of unknown function (DUF4403)